MIIIIFHSQTQATFESLLKVPLLRCYVYCDLAKRLSTHCQVCILFIIFVNNNFFPDRVTLSLEFNCCVKMKVKREKELKKGN